MDDCLPTLFNDAESADDWSAVLQKLRDLSEAGNLAQLPDWLAMEMIWMRHQFSEPLSRLTESGQRLNVEAFLAMLESLPCWQQAVDFDERFPLLDPVYLHEQGVDSEVAGLSDFLALPDSDKLSPHPLFNCGYYKQHEQLSQGDPHPLVHFFRHSSGYRAVSAMPNQYFDCDWYRDHFLRDQPGANPLLHYLAHFQEPQIQPSAHFNNHYLRLTQSLATTEDPLVFYLKQVASQGIAFRREGFSPCPYFDRGFYLARYPDIQTATDSGGFDPFHHFWLYGINEGRQGHAWLPQTMATQAETCVFADQKKQAILVLGMHRSGTSALTRAINFLGAALASRLMEANFANEAGYWESVELEKIHDDILAFLHTRWDDIVPFDEAVFKISDLAHYQFLLTDYVVREFGESTCFVLKDPRMCRLVPLWLTVLQALNVQIKIVIPFRNPLEVVASLKKRDGFSREKALLLWLRHVSEAERNTRGLRRCFVNYAELLTSHRRVLGEIAAQCDFRWPDYSERSLTSIKQFLNTEHYHQRATEEALTTEQVPDWISKVYAALNGLTKKSDDPLCLDELDKVYAFVHQVDRIYCPIIVEQAQVARQLQDHHKQIQTETRLFAERIGQLLER